MKSVAQFPESESVANLALGECRYSLDGTQPQFDSIGASLLLADWLSATEFLFAASCIGVVGFLTAFRIMHEVG